MSEQSPSDVRLALSDDLKVPSEYSHYDDTSESAVIVRLEEWKRKVYSVLCNLRDRLRSQGSLDARLQAEVIYATAAFDSDEPWVLESSRRVAQDILSAYETPDCGVLEHILSGFVKPIFRPNPHPSLNAETGRKLPRAAGGPHGHLDYLEGQEWKSYPAIADVLSWSILHADTRSVETLWHLFIPPIMILLDDYEAGYKLRGVRLVLQLLEVTSSDLMKRTGIDTLILTSLKTSLTFLHNAESADLIRTAIRCTIHLIELTTASGSAARFDQLSALLGESIIGNIWVYASREPQVLQASVEAIPDILRVLGIGASRYLKGLIPQLIFPITPAPENGSTLEYKRASLQALEAVMQACAPRVHKWKASILNAVLKCWVDLSNSAAQNDETIGLKNHLQSVCQLLLTTCRNTVEPLDEEFQRMTALDPVLFCSLLSAVQVSA